jgi:hypothetical protein
MVYLNYHFKDKMRDCNKSGSHDVFQNYVWTKPYLFVYYQSLQKAGPELQNYAFAELMVSVKQESTRSTNKSRGASRKKKMNKKRRRIRGINHELHSAIKKVGDVSCHLFLLMLLIKSYDINISLILFMNTGRQWEHSPCPRAKCYTTGISARKVCCWTSCKSLNGSI